MAVHLYDGRDRRDGRFLGLFGSLLTADREQTRRDADVWYGKHSWDELIHEAEETHDRAGCYGTLYLRLADALRDAEARLEQAERERDEAVALADDQNAAASLAAFRLAQVPALVEAARNAYLRTTDETIKALGIALADYEQEPDVPS